MKRILVIIVLTALAASSSYAADPCIKENLQLKQKLIELQSQILQTQYIEITKELEAIKIKEKADDKKNDSPDITVDDAGSK